MQFSYRGWTGVAEFQGDHGDYKFRSKSGRWSLRFSKGSEIHHVVEYGRIDNLRVGFMSEVDRIEREKEKEDAKTNVPEVSADDVGGDSAGEASGGVDTLYYGS